MKEYFDTSGRLSITIGDDAALFDVVAARLERIYRRQPHQRLHGVEQRYWDYDLEGVTVVLHSDAFAGVSIYVEDGTHDAFLRRIAQQVAEPSAAGNRDLRLRSNPDRPARGA